LRRFWRWPGVVHLAEIAGDIGAALAPRPAPKSTATLSWDIKNLKEFSGGCRTGKYSAARFNYLLRSLLRQLQGEVLENV
jgi:hypothetical protein